jgi:hypothetical protein
MAFSDDMKRLARDAIADVGNTYQAILMQDTGWARAAGLARGLNQEVGESIAKQEVEADLKPPEPGVDLNYA